MLKVRKKKEIVYKKRKIQKKLKNFFSKKIKCENASKKHILVRINHPMKRGTFWRSSHFGRRFNTKKNTFEVHGGVDFAAPEGTPVYAAHDGVVSEISIKSTGFGKSIVLNHTHLKIDNKVSTRYAHLSKILVKPNESVCMGQIIGLVGSTGNTRGKRNASHLHFELIIDNKKYNPLLHIKKIKSIQ